MICWRRVGDLRQALLLLSARDLCSYSLPMLSARVLYLCYWLPCLSAPDLGSCFDTRLLISAPAHLSVPAPALCSGSLISDLCSCSLFLLSAPVLCSCSLFSALTLCSRSLLSLSAFSALALDSRSQLSWSRSRCSLSGLGSCSMLLSAALCSLPSALCSLLSGPALCSRSLLSLSALALCSRFLLSLSALALARSQHGRPRMETCASMTARVRPRAMMHALPSHPSLQGLPFKLQVAKPLVLCWLFPHHCILLPDPCRARDAPMHVCLCALLA